MRWVYASPVGEAFTYGDRVSVHGRGLMLEYRGYIGKVVYDDEAEVLHAKVINTGPYP